MKTLGDGESTGNTLWMCEDIWFFVIFSQSDQLLCYDTKPGTPSQIFSHPALAGMHNLRGSEAVSHSCEARENTRGTQIMTRSIPAFPVQLFFVIFAVRTIRVCSQHFAGIFLVYFHHFL